MRVTAYNIDTREKQPLALANRRKHQITLVTNFLNNDTVGYASNKEAIIVSSKNFFRQRSA